MTPDENTLRSRLAAIVLASPSLMRVLAAVRDMGLPDPLLFSGAVYQTVWNALTGRSADYGIKDYDVGYFDPDTSEAAESRAIAVVAGALDEPLRDKVEVRNQARVHLWFEGKFGQPYPPLSSTAEALTRFVCPAFAVGVRQQQDGTLGIEAPFGLDDVFAMRLRVNPARGRARDWERVIGSAISRWPELTVVAESYGDGDD